MSLSSELYCEYREKSFSELAEIMADRKGAGAKANIARLVYEQRMMNVQHELDKKKDTLRHELESLRITLRSEIKKENIPELKLMFWFGLILFFLSMVASAIFVSFLNF